MRLNRLTNTCSMYELGDVDYSDILKYPFKENLKELIKLSNIHDKDGIIIYNTNFDWIQYFRARILLRLSGFKQVHSYKGFTGNSVYVLMKKVNCGQI